MFLLSYLCTEKSSFFLSYHTIEMGIGRGFVMNRPFSRMNQPWGCLWRGVAKGMGLARGLFQPGAGGGAGPWPGSISKKCRENSCLAAQIAIFQRVVGVYLVGPEKVPAFRQKCGSPGKKYRGSSNRNCPGIFSSYLLYFFSMSQIFCTRSACLPPSNLAPKNASRIFFASSFPTTRAPNAMICALLCLTVISAE